MSGRAPGPRYDGGMARDVVSLTEQLVEVDTSPGFPTAPLIDRIVEIARAGRAEVTLQAGRHDGVELHNLVLRYGGDGPAGLVLAGHLDTVPWRADTAATTTPVRDGRQLFGRGTADMKGALAASLLAALSRAEGLKRPLVVAMTFAEEVGCHGAAHLMDDVAIMGDLSEAVCLVGEPTELVPVVGHKGYATGELVLKGEPAHSSNPWAGADASVALGTLLRDLHLLRDRLREEGDPSGQHVPPCSTLNTGLVTAGRAKNIVPDEARVSIELRPLPTADEAGLRERVDACLQLACAAAPGVSGTAHWVPGRPAFNQDPDHPAVRWLAERADGRIEVVPFYTEAELYRRGMGVPTIVCGPGSIAAAHRSDEAVSFDQLEAGQALYEQAIDAFCR